ncbi:MAG: neutral/alkaline non-lysosomal ceramidase N-terminal domain-containing protein [Clostridia bacterium]|nr:neutral/alkaline non-lysosomal ceramidase N-terminal domain-containing protein [Clostridia bacterium]
MLCGLYEIDVTPALGMNIPGYFESRPASGIREPLHARALACSNAAGEIFVLVNIDTISIDITVAQAVRRRVEQLAGIPGDRIMVSATHTHTGGPVDDFVPGTSSAEYMAWLADRAADAAVMAWNRRQPAKLGYGKAYEDSIAFIRRYNMKDGTFKTNPGFDPDNIARPAGSIDPEVGVIKIEDMNGGLIGVITNYACHLDTVTGNRYCPDYPGELERVLKSVYGDQLISIFLTGACGNINHYDFMHRSLAYYREANPPHYKRMGRILAGGVIRALADIETCETEELAVESASFPAVIRTPEEKDIASAKALLAEHPYEVVTITEQGVTGNRYRLIDRHYAQSLLSVAAIQEKQVEIPVQAARIGRSAIVGLPCELFVEFGLDIKARSGFEHTFISTLTNARFGYIAVREAFGQGGYETTISGDTMMSPETGYDMTDTVVRLMEKLR